MYVSRVVSVSILKGSYLVNAPGVSEMERMVIIKHRINIGTLGVEKIYLEKFSSVLLLTLKITGGVVACLHVTLPPDQVNVFIRASSRFTQDSVTKPTHFLKLKL